MTTAIDRPAGSPETAGLITHVEMMTWVNSITYDFQNRIGWVEMPPGACTDMPGAIAFFERIDPLVAEIHTVVGNALDTSYLRGSSGEWTALRTERVGSRDRVEEAA